MWRGGVESAVRDRISCAWIKWRELASLLVNKGADDKVMDDQDGSCSLRHIKLELDCYYF